MRAPGPVWVMGAGLIGTYVGGRLAAAGVDVRFIGRASFGERVAQGLCLSDLDGGRWSVPRLNWHTELPPADPAPSLVLLCVKSAATASAAAQLQARLPQGSVVLSLQNGVDNAAQAQQAAPGLQVLPGMVPFNVAQPEAQRLHQGTSGTLMAADDPALRPWVPVFGAAGLPLQLRPDMLAVQWAKLLLNLNNPVNALSGRPLRAQLLDRDWRACTAALMEEALQVLQAAGQPVARLTPLPPGLLPALLRAPTPVFRVLAARMLRIDDEARSSMADDLAKGRPPEIDALCGPVVRLGRTVGRPTPRNQAMVEALSASPLPSRSALAWRQHLAG
jgi:2-dehydropantoate 2-reductase